MRKQDPNSLWPQETFGGKGFSPDNLRVRQRESLPHPWTFSPVTKQDTGVVALFYIEWWLCFTQSGGFPQIFLQSWAAVSGGCRRSCTGPWKSLSAQRLGALPSAVGMSPSPAVRPTFLEQTRWKIEWSISLRPLCGIKSQHQCWPQFLLPDHQHELLASLIQFA